MENQKKTEELVRIYRDESKSDDVLIEVLGQPVAALKQMKAEAWILKEKTTAPEKK